MKTKQHQGMKHLFISGIICFMIPTWTFSQVTTNEELKQLVQQSYSYYPKMAEAENNIVTAEEKKSMVELNSKPEISANGNYNYVLPKIAFPINGREIQFAPVHNVGAMLNASWTIYDFGRLKAEIDKEKASIQLSKDQVEVTKSQLKAQVAGIYYTMVFLKKYLTIEDSIIRFYQDNQKLAERRVSDGEGLQTDVLNFKSNVDAEENKKLDLQMALSKQQNMLAYTTGVSEIKGDDFDFSRLATLYESGPGRVEKVENKNPELTMANDKIMAAKKGMNAAILSNKPTLNIHAGGGIKNGYVPEVNDMRFNSVAGITFMMPLDAFGKTNQQKKYQQTLVKQQELSLHSLQSQLEKDIKQNNSNYWYLRSKIKNSENQIKAAKEAQQLIISRYQNGVATFVDLSAAEANVERAYLSKLQDEYQMCMENIELAKLMGYDY